jgi:hypothetical protein
VKLNGLEHAEPEVVVTVVTVTVLVVEPPQPAPRQHAATVNNGAAARAAHRTFAA